MPRKKQKNDFFAKVKKLTTMQKLLVFIGVFSLLAGVYFAFQSSAATRTTIKATDMSGGKVVSTSKGKVKSLTSRLGYKFNVSKRSQWTTCVYARSTSGRVKLSYGHGTGSTGAGTDFYVSKNWQWINPWAQHGDGTFNGGDLSGGIYTANNKPNKNVQVLKVAYLEGDSPCYDAKDGGYAEIDMYNRIKQENANISTSKNSYPYVTAADIKGDDGKFIQDDGTQVFQTPINREVTMDINRFTIKFSDYKKIEYRYCVTAKDTRTRNIVGEVTVGIGVKLKDDPGNLKGGVNPLKYSPNRYTEQCQIWYDFPARYGGTDRLKPLSVYSSGVVRIKSIRVEWRPAQ